MVVPYAGLALAAFRGREAEAAAIAEANAEDAERRGEGGGLTFVQWATAVLCNGLGRERALAAARQASEDSPAQRVSSWAVAELIEAATRTGAPDQAASSLGRLSDAARASGTDWALGIEARCRALATSGQAAEALYREAIDWTRAISARYPPIAYAITVVPRAASANQATPARAGGASSIAVTGCSAAGRR